MKLCYELTKIFPYALPTTRHYNNKGLPMYTVIQALDKAVMEIVVYAAVWAVMDTVTQAVMDTMLDTVTQTEMRAVLSVRVRHKHV